MKCTRGLLIHRMTSSKRGIHSLNKLNNYNCSVPLKVYNLRSKSIHTDLSVPLNVYNLRSKKNIHNNALVNVAVSLGNKKRSRTEYEITSDIKQDNVPRKRTKVVNKTYTFNDFNVFYPADDVSNDKYNLKNWVSASATASHLLGDPLLDYYKNINKSENGNKSNTSNSDNLLSLLCGQGNNFEKSIVEYFEEKYGESVKRATFTNYPTRQAQDLTFKYMLQGVPIILQASLYNEKNMTYGIADFVVRSDFINEIFEERILSEEESVIKASKLKGQYHYVVIDAKWTTMTLMKDGLTIYNEHRFPAYKGQLLIYNCALGQLQGYTPPKAYILAKAWHHVSGNERGYNCFTKLGHINYMDSDNSYIKKTVDAIKWVREVQNNYKKMTLDPPSRPELYPNMSNRNDTPYHSLKVELANNIKELTQICHVGHSHRQNAHNNGVYKWDDENCNSEILGITGEKLSNLVDAIIKINRDSDKLIEPDIVTDNINNWQEKHQLDFYIDFETLLGALYEKVINLEDSEADNQILFMIGVGYERNNKWIYKEFTMSKITRAEEGKIMNDFIEYIEDIITKYMKDNKIKNKKICQPRFFHWSHAERSTLNIVDQRHNKRYSKWLKTIQWIDMYQVFKNTPIVIKGAFDFGLKTIARAMESHNMIKIKWPSGGPSDGADAMGQAINYYRNINSKNSSQNNKNNKIMQSIIDYNEIDCKAIYEIVTYLRNNHTQ